MGFLARKLGGLRQIMRFDNRWQVIAQRLLFSRTSLYVYRRGTLEILVDHSHGDVVGLRDCFNLPMYRQFLPQLALKSPLRALDFGSHIGSFPLMLKDSGLEISQLASVELNPATFSRMRFNIDRNFPTTQRTLLNAAIGGQPGEIELFMGQGSVANSMFDTMPKPGTIASRLKVLTVDEAIDQAGMSEGVIDICKLDVECAEYAVLSNPGHSGLKRCRAIMTEIHTLEGHTQQEVISAIEALGFRQVKGSPDREVNVYCFINEKLD